MSPRIELELVAEIPRVLPKPSVHTPGACLLHPQPGVVFYPQERAGQVWRIWGWGVRRRVVFLVCLIFAFKFYAVLLSYFLQTRDLPTCHQA